MPATTIAFYNHKGGVGKTTNALLLSYSFINEGRRVLVIDLDIQHNLTMALVGLGYIMSNEDKILTSFDLARDPRYDPVPISVDVLDLNGERKTIDVIPSLERDVPKLIKGEVPISNPFALRPIVDKLKDKYDYIILDLPPVFLASTQWGLFVADYMIIPINVTDFSQYSAYILVRDILPLILSYKEIKVLGFLVSNVRERNPDQLLKIISKDLNEYIGDVLVQNPQLLKYFYKDIVFPIMIPQDAELRELIRFKEPYPPVFERIRTSRYPSTVKLREIIRNKLAAEVEKRISEMR